MRSAFAAATELTPVIFGAFWTFFLWNDDFGLFNSRGTMIPSTVYRYRPSDGTTLEMGEFPLPIPIIGSTTSFCAR